MALIRKHTLYQLFVMVWGVVVFGVAIVVFSGNAEPVVSPSELPVRGPIPLFGSAVVAWLAGAFVVGRLERRDWKVMGRRAGLSPERGGLFGKPDLVGTVDGHTVRVWTESRRTGSSSEGGSSKTTYTIVEVDLSAPAEEGLLVTTGEGGLLGGRGADLSLEGTAVDGVEVVGADEAVAREMLTSEIREALRKPARLDTVVVGDVSEVIMAAMPDTSGRIVGAMTSALERKVERGIYGDATSVRAQQKGVLLDGTELRHRVDALIAVADGFEAARAQAGRERDERATDRRGERTSRGRDAGRRDPR